MSAVDVPPEDLSWERTRLFMRRPWLDDLPEAPAMPAGFALRRYVPADRAPLASLLSRAFDEAWTEAAVDERLAAAPDVEAIYVLASDGALIATASARIMPGEYPDAQERGPAVHRGHVPVRVVGQFAQHRQQFARDRPVRRLPVGRGKLGLAVQIGAAAKAQTRAQEAR